MSTVSVTGCLARDPIIKATKTGKAMAFFTVAVNRQVWTQQGYKEVTDWVGFTAWENLAQAVGNRLKKGSRVHVEGFVTQRSFDTSDGRKQWKTEITANLVSVSVQEDYQSQGSEGGAQQGYSQPQAGWGNPGAPAAGGRSVYSEGPTQRGFGQFGTPQPEKQRAEETSMFPADQQEAVGRAAHPSQCEEDIPF